MNEQADLDELLRSKGPVFYDFEVGDEAWIYAGNHCGNMTKGKVVHKFQHYNRWLYVIEIETIIDPYYECRSGFYMGIRPNMPPWQRDEMEASHDHS